MTPTSILVATRVPVHVAADVAKRTARLAVLLLTYAAVSAEADTQHVEIYETADTSWPFDLGEATTRIWTDAVGCVAAEDKCNSVDADGLGAHLGRATERVGEGVGIQGTDGSWTLRLILHGDKSLPESGV